MAKLIPIDTRKGQAFKATHISYIHNYTGLFSDILTQRKLKKRFFYPKGSRKNAESLMICQLKLTFFFNFSSVSAKNCSTAEMFENEGFANSNK